MSWSITYHTEAVESFVLGLPDGLLARYLRLTDMMLEYGANLGMPHTRAMSDGLYELRIKGKEGIARVIFCTPSKELKLARARLAEVKKS